MTIRQDVADWLGDTTVTDEQAEQLGAAMDTISARWPDPDAVDTRRDTLNGAAWIILGDDTLEQIADRWHRAKRAERGAMAELTGALLASDTGARGSEADLILRSGAAKMTVRKALGR